MDDVRRIADAVLYEGYVLWPYRRSALKNQRRWTFGGVYPRAHSEGRDDDPWVMRTQCLVEAAGDDGAVSVGVRFLHVVRRGVARATAGGDLEPVDELTVAGQRHLAWEEAVEREVAVDALLRAPRRRVPIEVAAGHEEETLLDADGRRAGAIVRTWEPLQGAVEVSAEALAAGVYRLTVTIANTSPWAGGPREAVLPRTFCSTHTVLRATGAAFLSLTDPRPTGFAGRCPERLLEAAAACDNTGTWPVLVGAPGERGTLLSSPIILEDHPQIAPESPGDLFDGGEIDHMLTLNILSLTDDEKAEMRDSDPRTRAILERTEALSEAELARLHGTIRDFRVLR